MNYENRDWEFSLKDLFFHVLYHWKGIFILAVVFSVLLGLFMGYRTNQNNENAIAAAAADSGYEEKLAKYEHEAWILSERLKDFEEKFAEQQAYMSDSVLMQLDPHNTFEAVASIYVSTDYQIMPGMEYQNPDYSATVVSVYQKLLGSHDTTDDISNSISIESKYLKEIVTVSLQTEKILSITVWHSDAELAEAILDLYMNKMIEQKPQIEALVGAHSLSVVTKSVGQYTDAFIVNRQGTELDRLLDFGEEILKRQATVEALKVPEHVKPSTASVKASTIKGAIIGGVAGAVVYVALVCVMFVFSDKMYSATELKKRFGVHILGSVIDQDKKFDLITCMLRKCENRLAKNSDENVELITENICMYGKGIKVLLLAGNYAPSIVNDITVALQRKNREMELVMGSSVLSDAKTITLLQRCDGVIMVAKCGKTNYSQIVEEIGKITDAGSSLVGYVVLD